MTCQVQQVRVLIVPGLHDSGPDHWQTWLATHHKSAVRVQQDDWASADLVKWSERIGETLASDPTARWVAVAHSFGCLALTHRLAQANHRVESALLVAPAAPEKFGVAAALPQEGLGIPSAMLASENDPWMPLDAARAWARLWRSQFINLGAVGHINVESGFGPLPQAKTLVALMIQRVERRRRASRAHPLEFSFAI